MCDGDTIEGRVSAGACGPTQQFEVHHVIDDDGIFPWLAVPATDTAHFGIESGRQRPCAVEEDAIIWRLRTRDLVTPDQPQHISKRAVHHKTQIVSAPVELLLLKQPEPVPGFAKKGGIVRKSIKIKDGAGIESAGPPSRVTGLQLAGGNGIGAGKAVRRD